ncbi:MAG: hypothetical protein N2645_16155 [Clostridia bacterium]|nr:hypothetical protein [Clostridia bacterium]
MRSKDLLLTNLVVTEDNYSFYGSFTLSSSDKSITVNLSDLDSDIKLNEIKNLFHLEETNEEIKKILMDKISENAQIGSHLKEGEKYQESSSKSSVEKNAGSLDMA